MLDAAGLGALTDRIFDSVRNTREAGAAAHIVAFLNSLGITDTTEDEVRHWWRARGQLAHGHSADLDPAKLDRLVAVFQRALRRAAGAEAVQ
ncbi:hypothetical protein GCM10027449_26240 [Sinomonas notoginsengisoli]|uniref:hypothetical protein n=1 Tax=Sinomonas notoginsengisoli TaxID=1457311 RepID=UPI001F1B40AC|nr:hypothetical protein [Sinomonas notoginsengisoli]